jgi:hypothetical protein
MIKAASLARTLRTGSRNAMEAHSMAKVNIVAACLNVIIARARFEFPNDEVHTLRFSVTPDGSALEIQAPGLRWARIKLDPSKEN